MVKVVKIKGNFARQNVISENKGPAKALYTKSRFGEVKQGKIQYSLVEAAYLVEKGKMSIVDYKGNKLKFDAFVSKVKRTQGNFWVRYCVFRDMRDRGYVVKTALKFGADFRVYDRGIKPGEDHAKWIVYPVHETEKFTWYEFSAKNRVAHSTRKKLLLGIVDEENDVTYYEVAWTKP
jgi:tRNA-intron endonuclease